MLAKLETAGEVVQRVGGGKETARRKIEWGISRLEIVRHGELRRESGGLHV